MSRGWLAAAGIAVAGLMGAQAAGAAEVDACASYIVVEADTGREVTSLDADMVRAPASMVKMMMMLMVCEGVDQEKWSLEQDCVISARAEAMGGSQVYLEEGEEWSLEDLVVALSVASANDAAVAIAEALWGSVEDYLDAANARARKLGMEDTVIRTPNGLPPDDGELPDETTARDMARLARACLGHPRILEWAGMPAVEYREGSVKPNTNKLLGAYEGLDGLKTGYTNAAGWCFAGTALRDGVRLVAVVMGCDRNTRRFSATEELLEEGFAVVQRRRVLAAGQQMATAVPLNNAELDAIPLSAAGDVWVVTHDDDLDKLQFVLEHDPVIQAPVRPGDVLGSVEVRLDGQVVSRTDLTVDTPVPAGTWPWKLRQSVLRRGGGVAAGLS